MVVLSWWAKFKCHDWEMTHHHTKKELQIAIAKSTDLLIELLEFLGSKNIAPIIGFPVTRWNTSSTWEQKTVSQ